ncbi:hypothetical protein SDC9_142699 [bioreactor metagenome]|uniref:Uncharacterized protein n=1 Tax=bioreactor metagenome TaxID=1076179 RepID=A0A645E182_9ZZZZ
MRAAQPAQQCEHAHRQRLEHQPPLGLLAQPALPHIVRRDLLHLHACRQVVLHGLARNAVGIVGIADRGGQHAHCGHVAVEFTHGQ